MSKQHVKTCSDSAISSQIKRMKTMQKQPNKFPLLLLESPPTLLHLQQRYTIKNILLKL